MTGQSCSSQTDETEIRNYLDVRRWLEEHHRKHLALLDRFLLELRRGRIAQYKPSSNGTNHTTDRRVVIHRTVDLLRHMVGSTKWKNPAQLHLLLRGLGHELQTNREPAIGNVVRRIMAAVREEANLENENTPNAGGVDSGRLSLQSMLWALPQHVKTSSRSMALSAKRSGDHQRQESFADADIVSNEYPACYYQERSGLKSTVMEAMDEIVNELEDLYKNINEQVVNHIHSGEIILTSGRSKTVELFLKAAAAKKLDFQVIVCEGAPRNSGHAMAKALSDAGLDVTLINDSAVFAVMARVNKVILPAHAVLANGGLMTASGGNLVALAAKHNSVPVVCTTGLFKLCPVFPHEGQDTMNDLLSPSSVMDYAEVNAKMLEEIEFVNPLHDIIKPEHVDLFITNVGSFQPSFLYRLLAEYYHSDDWDCFD